MNHRYPVGPMPGGGGGGARGQNLEHLVKSSISVLEFSRSLYLCNHLSESIHSSTKGTLPNSTLLYPTPPDPTHPNPPLSYPKLPYPTPPHTTHPTPILTPPTLPYTYPYPSYPTLPRPTPPHPTLPYPYPTQPHPTQPHPTQPHHTLT